jgi:alpha-L-rhamnosidase
MEQNVLRSDFIVLFFHKSFELDKQPASFVVNISGDTRYRFFLNGQPVCFGPAKGSKYHWYFETVDIASIDIPMIPTLY